MTISYILFQRTHTIILSFPLIDYIRWEVPERVRIYGTAVFDKEPFEVFATRLYALRI